MTRHLARVLGPVALALGAVVLVACSSGSSSDAPSPTTAATTPGTARTGPPVVVASTDLVGALVRSVGGDEVEVRVLAEAGDDPATMTVDDPTAVLEGADLVVLVDPTTYERGLGDLVAQAEAGDVGVLALAPQLGPIPLGGSELEPGSAGADGATDPHVWLDPDRWTQGARLVADALGTLDGIDGATLQANVAAFDDAVARADETVQATFGALPGPTRVLVTDLGGLGYVADRHGFELVLAAGPDLAAAATGAGGPSVVFTSADRAESLVESLARTDPALAVVALDLEGSALGPPAATAAAATTAYVDLLVGIADAIATAVGT